ncbi:hypothetical protein AYO20_10960 [Fonsecaea nubica]|uniref:Protein ZIP4 homolog n=1 Tax=Fonsecaea nubica TaxID=856822 RepID=A0A178C262_9EURO|nr:hypothetical protein AYO20_10960 [Fonsecaea nubica]OAL23564.1 hypothetical protein AYO20_10960 [Fonsecaea nubica]
MLPKEQRSTAGSILEFTSHLETVVNPGVTVSAEEFPDISIYLEALPLPRKALTPGQRTEFDRRGVALWNTCCRLSRGEGCPQLPVNLARGDYHQPPRCPHLTDAPANIDYFKSHSELAEAVLVGYSGLLVSLCLTIILSVDAGLVDLASKVIEQLAVKSEDLLQRASHDDLDIEKPFGGHELKKQAWKQGRIELAEHFYSQFEASKSQLDSVRIGQALDLCYEMGNDQLAVRALLALEEGEAGQEAFQLLQVLREEYGHRLPVILLQLEVAAKDSCTNADAFSANLLSVVRSAHLIHSNHKLTAHAIRVLESYIVLRLASSDEHEWTEKAIITLIWLITAESEGQSSVDMLSLQGTFEKIYRAWNKALSAEATHGALILFWKRIEHTFDHGLKEITIKWCRVALHQLFSKAGDQNVGKIERRIVKCQIDLRDFEAAFAALETMSPARKQHPLSRYLRYCLALRRGDEADARSTLASLATVHDDRNKLLFAAVAEATQYGSKLQGAQLLQRILDKYKDNLPPEIDASALLRPAVSFTQKRQLSEETTMEHQLQESRWLEKTSYNTAVQYLQSWPTKYVIDLLHYSCQMHLPTHAPSQVQYQKHIHETGAKYIQAILYTVQARSAATLSTEEDIPKTAYSGKAPPHSPIEIKSTLYRNVFAKYSEIRNHLNALREGSSTGLIEQEVLEGITQKLIVLTPLAFEALLFLVGTSTADVSGPTPVQHDFSLSEMVDQMVLLNPPQKTYSLFAGMILSASMSGLESTEPSQPSGPESSTPPVPLPVSTTTNLLAKLISGLRNHSDYDSNRAARWMRCMVQIVLDRRRDSRPQNQCQSESEAESEQQQQQQNGRRRTEEKNLSTVVRITEHALDLATSAASPAAAGGNDYPPEELEWLAVTLFNLAIDLYASPLPLPAASGSASDSAPADHDEHIPEHKNNKNKNKNQGSSSSSSSSGEMVTLPQFWARKAVAVADVLAMMNTATAGAGAGAGDSDAGALATVLRERCQRLHWDV